MTIQTMQWSWRQAGERTRRREIVGARVVPVSAGVDEADGHELHVLVERARRGDEAAFADLYDRFAIRLFGFVRARCVNAEDAEDAMADVFLAAWRALPAYEWTGAPFAAWLFGIAARTTASAARRAVRRPQTVAWDVDAHAAVGDMPGYDERIVEFDEVIGRLEALPADQRQVIELRFFADLAVADVARLVGRSEGAVRQLQFRALERLRHADQREAS